jgi:DNA-binding response OmpR family regulator
VSEDIPLAKEPLLVVEDEADILESWRDNLAKEGFRVTGVTSGEEGLYQRSFPHEHNGR